MFVVRHYQKILKWLPWSKRLKIAEIYCYHWVSIHYWFNWKSLPVWKSLYILPQNTKIPIKFVKVLEKMFKTSIGLSSIFWEYTVHAFACLQEKWKSEAILVNRKSRQHSKEKDWIESWNYCKNISLNLCHYQSLSKLYKNLAHSRKYESKQDTSFFQN